MCLSVQELDVKNQQLRDQRHAQQATERIATELQLQLDLARDSEMHWQGECRIHRFILTKFSWCTHCYDDMHQCPHDYVFPVQSYPLCALVLSMYKF